MCYRLVTGPSASPAAVLAASTGELREKWGFWHCGTYVEACRGLAAPYLGWQLQPAREGEAALLSSGFFWLKVFSLFLFLSKCLKCFVNLSLSVFVCLHSQCCCLLACSASGHQVFGFIRPEFHDLVHAEQDEGQKPEAPADGRCDPPVVIHARGAARGRLTAEVHIWWRRKEGTSLEAKYTGGFLY